MMDAPDLNSLQNMTPAAIVSEVKGGQIRLDALRETAIGLGTRGGLSKRAEQINDRLKLYAGNLDKVYNFRQLLISAPAGISKTTQYYVLPPVISESNQDLKTMSDDVIQAADKIYRIEAQAKFITAPPTWTQYLSQTVTVVEAPDPTLMPRDDKEREAWKKWIAEGWDAGTKQADAIFDVNLAKLNRDYQGMIRYRVLLKQHLVSSPYVAENRMGVTGGGNELSIDARELRITAMPGLNSHQQEWDPTIYGMKSIGDVNDVKNLR